MVYKYGFKEYLEAVEKNPTQENIAILAEWILEFGEWNGDSYIIDKDKRICLKPIFYEDFIEKSVCYFNQEVTRSKYL